MSSRWNTALVLLLILAVGLVLRVATLSQQSLWFDEAQWVRQMVDSPSLSVWLQRSDDANRDMVPLYFILEYGWYHHLVHSTTGMRWLSVLIGMLVVLMTFWFGLELYGSRVGFLASLFVSLSPLHIHYAQELRPYGLMTLLGLVSAYAFHKALHQSARRWWIVNIIANSLLMWTHLFGLWLIVTEGVFLLLFHLRPFRRILWWSVANAVPMIPIMLLVLTWKAPGQPALSAHWLEVLSTWLYADSFYLTFLVYYRSFSLPRDLFAGLPGCFVYLFPACTIVLSVSLFAGACSFVVRPTCQRAGISLPPLPETTSRREIRLFRLMWYALPCLWLLLFSIFIVPAFQLRYVIYSTPALYLMAAAGIAGMRGSLRFCMTAVLIATLGFLGFLAVVLPVRSDEKGAARYVQANIKDGENVIWQPSFTHDTFEFNRDPNGPPVTTRSGARVHDELAQVDTALRDNAGLWIVHGHWNSRCATTRAAIVERYLTLRNIMFTRNIFIGRSDIVVYHCVASTEFKPPEAQEEIARLRDAVTNDLQDVPIRWNLRLAVEKSGHFPEAAELYLQELRAIPSSPDLLAALEENLEYVDWDDWSDGSYVDTYVGELVSGLARVLKAAGHDYPVQEINEWHQRFPANKAVIAILEKYRNPAEAAPAGSQRSGREETGVR